MTGPAPGTLFVVATPIGNLEDITLRALRILRAVDVVAAEDTRHTGRLLRHYQIGTPLVSLHEHNERQRTDRLVERLRAGKSVALVSDAGTPAISDPGARLVHAVRAAGFRVDPVPGPSAVTAALSAAGVGEDRFVFAGFPPTRSKDRKRWFDWVGGLRDVTVVAFESPHRLQKTLRELSQILVNRPILLARELTKLHEEWSEGSAGDLADRATDPRGEYVLVIPPEDDQRRPRLVSDSEIAVEFGRTTESNPENRRAAIRQTATRLGLSPKTVYLALERLKEKFVDFG